MNDPFARYVGCNVYVPCNQVNQVERNMMIELTPFTLPDGSVSFSTNRTEAIMGRIEVLRAQHRVCLVKAIPGEYIHSDFLPVAVER